MNTFKHLKDDTMEAQADCKTWVNGKSREYKKGDLICKKTGEVIEKPAKKKATKKKAKKK